MGFDHWLCFYHYVHFVGVILWVDERARFGVRAGWQGVAFFEDLLFRCTL